MKEDCWWKNLKQISFANNIDDFNYIKTIISNQVINPKKVAIWVNFAGGHYSEPLTYFLQKNGYDIYYLDPKLLKLAREKLIFKGNKDDKTDAACAAYMLYFQEYHGFLNREQTIRPELNSRASLFMSLILQRKQYTKHIVQSSNRLRQLLVAIFPEAENKYGKKLFRIVKDLPTPQDIIASKKLPKASYLKTEEWQDIIVTAKKTIGVPPEIYRDLIKDLAFQYFETMAKLKKINQLIATEVKTHPYGKILLTFPSFGSIAAARIIGTIRDVNRFPNKKTFRKMLGVYVESKQSGNAQLKSRMGRQGNRNTRSELYLIIMRCISKYSPENDFRDYYQSHVSRMKSKRSAVIATAGKLAEIIYNCLKKEINYEYQARYVSSKVRKNE